MDRDEVEVHKTVKTDIRLSDAGRGMWDVGCGMSDVECRTTKQPAKTKTCQRISTLYFRFNVSLGISLIHSLIITVSHLPLKIKIMMKETETAPLYLKEPGGTKGVTPPT